jgi:hypothetical protein
MLCADSRHHMAITTLSPWGPGGCFEERACDAFNAEATTTRFQRLVSCTTIYDLNQRIRCSTDASPNFMVSVPDDPVFRGRQSTMTSEPSILPFFCQYSPIGYDDSGLYVTIMERRLV